jgi:uncharacterized protein YdhG (YjbR/CyaY superfamily)
LAKTDFKTPDDYLATLGDDDRALVTDVMDAIRAGVPGAEEVISYQIPAFKHHGFVFYVSAAKHHVSISCPPPFTVFDEFAAELVPYKKSKSAIQFPKNQPLPLQLITRMAASRAAENEARATTKG